LQVITVEWSVYDNEEEAGSILEDTDAVGPGDTAAPAAPVKNPRRAIEIIREQQQLREELQDYFE
jgi:hypothetical protein